MQPSFNPLADTSQQDHAATSDTDQPESPATQPQPEHETDKQQQQHQHQHQRVKHSSSSSDVKAAMPSLPTTHPTRSLQAQALQFVPDGGAREIKSEGYDGLAGEDDSAHTWANTKRIRAPGDTVTCDMPAMPLKKVKAGHDGHGHKGQPVSEAERRKIRRRVTNRESAKRIRDKRDEQMAQMSEQVAQLEAHKAALVDHMHSMETCCGQLTSQLKDLKQKWCATCVENVKLYRKIFELRKALNPGTADSQLASRLALEDELASKATTAAVPVIDGSTDVADTRLVPQ